MPQKIIAGVVLVGAIVAIFFIFSFSSSKPGVLLFQKPLADAQARKVIDVLDGMGVEYEYSREGLFRIGAEDKASIDLELTKEDAYPERHSVDGWEIFDTKDITTTEVEHNTKKRRALTRAISMHLEELDFIEEASIQLTFPKKEFLTDVDAPVTASVILKPAAHKEYLLKKGSDEVKGLQRLIARGVDKLEPQNITIFDQDNKELTDFEGVIEDKKLEAIRQKIKIVAAEKAKIENEVRRVLATIFSKERIDLNTTVEFDWQEMSEERQLIIPTILKEDNPDTPYDDSEYTTNVKVSGQEQRETFKGHRLYPQGPAGSAENVPPGVVEHHNRYDIYERNQNTENYDMSRAEQNIKHGNYKIKRITCAVAIDGRWVIEKDKNGNPIVTNGASYVREYIPVEANEVKQVEELVKGAIGYKSARKDIVTVRHIPFDHWKEFEKEDEELRRKRALRQTLMISLVSLLTLFIIALVIRAIQKELARRRRLYEEEQERRQSELRQQAMMQAQEEPVSEMSLEEAARRKLLEEVVNVAKERPDDVAAILRTWMADDSK